VCTSVQTPYCIHTAGLSPLPSQSTVLRLTEEQSFLHPTYFLHVEEHYTVLLHYCRAILNCERTNKKHKNKCATKQTAKRIPCLYVRAEAKRQRSFIQPQLRNCDRQPRLFHLCAHIYKDTHSTAGATCALKQRTRQARQVTKTRAHSTEAGGALPSPICSPLSAFFSENATICPIKFCFLENAG
jgi:hypothetical protein